MKLTRKQLNSLKKFIKNLNNLKGVYGSVKGLWYSEYYKLWNFEFQAIDNFDNKYKDLARFEEDELIRIINNEWIIKEVK